MTPRIGYQHDANGEKRQIQTAFVNALANTADTQLVAAVTGKRIAVLAICALCGASDTSVTLKSKGSGAGTAISSAKALAANGGWSWARGCEIDFLYVTTRGEALTVGTSTGSTVGLDVTYVLLD